MDKKNFDQLVKGVREMKGHIFGDAKDFLQLTDEEARLVELKLSSGSTAKKPRKRKPPKQSRSG